MWKRFLSVLLVLALCNASPAAPASAAAAAALPTVRITGESLTDWADKNDIREAELTYSDPAGGMSFSCLITIRPQGTSSLGYEKKNFTVAFQGAAVEMRPGWGNQSLYCLKANYIDPTHACNVVSARLAGQMNEATGLFGGLPNRGAIDGFPVWVTLNDEDAGVYTWNIPKAAWMFGMDEENENHIVMCCEEWTDGCTFRSDCFILNDDWSIEVGPATSKTIVKFDRLIDFIVHSSDEDFVQNFDRYLNLDACLNYYCFICIANANDNETKNMLMATWDGEIWQPMLYDLDSLWGISWNGKELTTDQAMGLINGGNRLFQRMWELLNPQLRERYAFLRGGVLSDENIWNEFNRYAATIPHELLALDNRQWHPEGEYIRTYELMQEQMAVYLPLMDAAFGYDKENPGGETAGT